MKCPECYGDIAENSDTCDTCDWNEEKIGLVRDFLTRDQRADQLHQDYNKNYEDLAKTNIVESNIDRNFLNLQAKNLHRYIGSCKGLRVCEIGVGQGFLCDTILSQSPERFVGIDVALSYLQNLENRNGVELFLANAETLPFENEFDLIVSTDVMEHVLNVGSYLYCINKALVKGGRAAIRVPYREGLLNYSPHFGYQHQFGHLRSFNKDILRTSLEQAGFRLNEFHLDGYSPYMPKKWAMDYTFGRVLISVLHKYVQRSMSHWSEVNNLPSSIKTLLLRPVEIVVIAEKISELERYE